MALVTTIMEMKAAHMPRERQAVQLAWWIQSIIMYPADRELKQVIDNHLIPNCPITGQDVVNAERIYGPNLGNLKGKTVACPGADTTDQPDPVPDVVMSAHHGITICMDIMYINKVTFLVTISKHIGFGTIEYIPNHQGATILAQAAQQVTAVYR